MIDLNMLSWNKAEEEQEEVLKTISKIKNYEWEELIIPENRKDCWYNCARILAVQSDDVLIALNDRIFEWFQDINWPGADVLIDRLHQIPPDKIRANYLMAIEKANVQMDEVWAENLQEVFKGYFGE